MGELIDLDARRPHVLTHVRCRSCGLGYVSVRPVGTPVESLECLCGALDSEACPLADCATCDAIAGEDLPGGWYRLS